MTDLFAEPLDRLLLDLCTPGNSREFLGGKSTVELDSALTKLGYQDALVREEDGGFGLGLRDLRATFAVLGARLCPLPVAETMMARALLSRSNVAPPSGHIVLATRLGGSDPDGLATAAIPLALSADYVLMDCGAQFRLFDAALLRRRAVAPGRSLAATAEVPEGVAPIAVIDAGSARLRSFAAIVRAATIAGLGRQILDMCTLYTGTRRQFGKPISAFQAVQQQLALLAEESAAANMAAAIGCDHAGFVPPPLAAAVAKMRASVAAERMHSISHALHGAIGFSEEYDLQLLTRRLAEERLADGSESYWAERIGRQRIAPSVQSSITFVRTALGAA